MVRVVSIVMMVRSVSSRPRCKKALEGAHQLSFLPGFFTGYLLNEGNIEVGVAW